MICKGCYRNMIVLKNTGSDLFEEAYFIINDSKAKNKTATENDMIYEANKIISGAQLHEKCHVPVNKTGKKRTISKPLVFLVGFAVGILLSFGATLIK